MFPGYNPYNPHAPQKAADVPDVPLAQFRAAQAAGASHLSADGKWIYCERFGAALEAEWDGSGYGVWWPCEELPADVAVIDRE